MQNPLSLIHPDIRIYWQNKYGPYLMSYTTADYIIYFENGRLDCFHPSGDRLARHSVATGQTIFCWQNDGTHPLTEQEYLVKLNSDPTESQFLCLAQSISAKP